MARLLMLGTINNHQMNWADISFCQDAYAVSDTGLVMNKKTGRILRAGKNSAGYLGVVLSYAGKKRWISVHRLVAMAFLENTEQFLCVNHKDCNRLNNKVGNLEWCSYRQNSLHATKNRRILSGSKHPKSIKCYAEKDGIVIGNFDTITDAAKAAGIPYPTAVYCLRNNKKSRGISFRPSK